MNTSQIPPGGWMWYEACTGWWAPHPIGYTFEQQKQNIIKHRRANMAMVLKHKLPMDDATVGDQLIKYQQARGAIAPDVLPKLTPPMASPQMSGAVKQAVAAIRKIAAGTAALAEWESLGLPHVEQSVANERAEICSRCPKNDKKPLTDIFTVPVANMIKKKMERLDGMDLHTPYDAQLATCNACWCPLRTKIWYPDDLVLKNLKLDQVPELNQDNPRCWILALQEKASSQVDTVAK